MSCRRYQRDIALHAGGDLPAEQADRLQQHLEECADCRLLLKQLAADRQAILRLATQPVEIDRIAASRVAVLEQIHGHPAKHGSSHRVWMALAATVMVALTALLVSRPWQQTAGHMELTRLEPTPLSPQTEVEASAPTPSIAFSVSTDKHEMEDSAPQPSMVVSTTQPKHEAPVHGSDAVTRPAPAAHQSPLLVKLESEEKDVVIYWLVDADECDANQPCPEPDVSRHREEQKDEQQKQSLG